MKFLNKLKNKAVATKAAVVTTAVGASSAASAEVPTEVGTFFTGLITDSASVMASAWPVMLAVTGGFIVMKIAKRAANKAT
jgi:hypothetical protein